MLALCVSVNGESMNHWKSFRISVEEKYPNFIGALNKGAEVNDIQAFEEKYQIRLPTPAKEIYLNSNGQNDKVNAYFFGMRFLSLDEVDQAMTREFDLIEQLASEWDMCSSFPEKHIRLSYANAKWVPIFYSGRGFIGIDLDPDINGIEGQVINFGINDEDKFVYAIDLNLFLADSTSKIRNSSKVKYNEEYKMYHYTDLGFSSALAKELMEKNT